MGTATICARCKCETHFTRISAVDYEDICVPCSKKEGEGDVDVRRELPKDARS